jgi:hypothetical protein
MTYPRKYAVATAAGDHLKDLDWDPMVDAANGMTIAGGITIQYPYSFIIRNVGGVYDAISGNGVLTYGGSGSAGGASGTLPAQVINAAILAASLVGGKVLLKSGLYSTGSNSIIGKSNVTLEFEAWKTSNPHDLLGATIHYTGTGNAIDYSYTTTRGDIHDFQIVNPSVYAPNGTAILMNGAYCFKIIHPMLTCLYGIDLRNLNTGKILGGGYICGTSFGTGTYGIRMGQSYATLLIEVDVDQISLFNIGIQLGRSLDEVTVNESVNKVHIHDTDLSANTIGLLLMGSVSDVHFHDNYMESMGTVCIRVTSDVNYYPMRINIHDNFLNAGVGNYFIDCPNGNPAYFIDMGYNFYGGGGKLTLGSDAHNCRVLVTGFGGVLELSSLVERVAIPEVTCKGHNLGTGAQQTIPHGLPYIPTVYEVFLSELTTGGSLAYQTQVPDETNIYVTAVLNKDYNWAITVKKCY